MHFQSALHGLQGIAETITGLENDAVKFRNEINSLNRLLLTKQRELVGERRGVRGSDPGTNEEKYAKLAVRAIETQINKINTAINESRARLSSLDGSIIAMKLQLQNTPVPATPVSTPISPSPVTIATPVPVLKPGVNMPPPVPPPVTLTQDIVPKPVSASPVPIKVTSVQIPEAPLSVTLPPIPSIIPVKTVLPETRASKKPSIIPWLLAGAAAFFL